MALPPPPQPSLFSEGVIINNITPAAGDAEPVQIRMISGATNNYSINNAYNFLLSHQNDVAKISWSHRTDNEPYRRDIHSIMNGAAIVDELAAGNPFNLNYTLDAATEYLVMHQGNGAFVPEARIISIHRIPPAPGALNGGYYQKYLKYKEKYLALKSKIF